jgi:hypothetical protein
LLGRPCAGWRFDLGAEAAGADLGGDRRATHVQRRFGDTVGELCGLTGGGGDVQRGRQVEHSVAQVRNLTMSVGIATIWCQTDPMAFPNPVNEKAARVVAAGVAVLSIAQLVTGWEWLLVVLALGFLLRVIAGPRFSPLGLLATRVIAPRLGAPVLVPGPPKRFAQSVGLTVTTAAAVSGIGFGWSLAASALVAVLVGFALLESVVGFCAGCWAFVQLMRAGLIPPEACAACNDIWARPADA